MKEEIYTRRLPYTFSLFNYLEVEEYLSNMSEGGMLLVGDPSNNKLAFTKDQPTKRRFRVLFDESKMATQTITDIKENHWRLIKRISINLLFRSHTFSIYMAENDASSDLPIRNHNKEIAQTYKPGKEFLTSCIIAFITMCIMITLINHFNKSSPERIQYLVSGQFGVLVFITLYLKEIYRAKADILKNLVQSNSHIIKEKKDWETYFGKFATKEKFLILIALIGSIVMQLALSLLFNIMPL